MSDITVLRAGPVAVIVIDRPPNNHVSVGLIGEIADALEAVDAERDCGAVVLASEGRVFCGGADLTPGGPDGRSPGAMAGALYHQAERLFCTKKPIIAAIQGAAVGAGLGLALVADFRVAAAEARFSANFAKLGFHSGFGISLTLPRVVERQHAARLLLTGRRIGGQEALGMGLVDQLAPLADVRASALALAHEIAANAPLAVQAMRATLRQGLAEAVRAQMPTNSSNRRISARPPTSPRGCSPWLSGGPVGSSGPDGALGASNLGAIFRLTHEFWAEESSDGNVSWRFGSGRLSLRCGSELVRSSHVAAYPKGRRPTPFS